MIDSYLFNYFLEIIIPMRGGMCLDYFTKGNNKHILFYSLTVYYVRPGNKLVFYVKLYLCICIVYFVFFFLLCFVLFCVMFSVSYLYCSFKDLPCNVPCIASCMVQYMQPACAPCAVSNDLILVMMMRNVENDNGDSGS